MPAEDKVETYFRNLSGQPAIIAGQLRDLFTANWPDLTVKPAWGFPCWFGNERVMSIIAHSDRCNVQFWSGARLAVEFPHRIEGTGKAMRHVKIRSPDEIDNELTRIVERAVRFDVEAPQRVR
ncbi:MAG: DUF1801 domain-containing protein [Pseudomonadota bacterium]